MWIGIGVIALHLVFVALCLYPTIQCRRVRYILEHGQKTKALITSVKETGGGYRREKPVVYTLKVKYTIGREIQIVKLHPPGLSKEEFPGFKVGTWVPIKFLPNKPNRITLTLPITLNKMNSASDFADVIGPTFALLFAISGAIAFWMALTMT